MNSITRRTAIWSVPVIATAIAAPAASASTPSSVVQLELKKVLATHHNGIVSAHIQFQRLDSGVDPREFTVMAVFGNVKPYTIFETFFLVGGQKSGEIKLDFRLPADIESGTFPVLVQVTSGSTVASDSDTTKV